MMSRSRATTVFSVHYSGYGYYLIFRKRIFSFRKGPSPIAVNLGYNKMVVNYFFSLLNRIIYFLQILLLIERDEERTEMNIEPRPTYHLANYSAK